MPNPTDTLRQQLNQLKALHEEGLLGAELYAEQRAVLERKLVEAVLATAPAGAPRDDAPSGTMRRPTWLLMLGAAVFVVVVAVAGYRWSDHLRVTGSDGDAAASAEAAASAPHPVSAEQIAAMVDTLAARLKQQPDDADGWVMLARSYAVLGRNPEAVAAYERAVTLRPDDAALLADQADALAVKNGRRVSGEPLKVVEHALKLDPDNLKALSLAGTARFEQADYAGAVRHWQRILTIASPQDRFAQDAQANIAEARELGKLPTQDPPPAAAGTAKAPAAAGAGAVSGVVSLDAALASRTRPDDTLFVFARPPSGSRMPLAILRKQVKDLPLRFRLDDTLAMSPAARISDAAQVIVGARISRSGSAAPQAGDLSGQSAPVAVGTDGLSIVISETAAR